MTDTECTHEHCVQCYTTTCRNPSRLRRAGYIPPAPTAANSCPLQACELTCGSTYHACKESEHRELCARRRVPCINAVNGCTAVMARASLAQHLQHCPASVVYCTMEWNRWPVFSTERQSRVPFSQTNLHARYGQLDVALALRDQRVLSEGLRAPHSVRRSLRNRLTERFPAVPLAINRTSYNKTMALCGGNELPMNGSSIEGFRPVSASRAATERYEDGAMESCEDETTERYGDGATERCGDGAMARASVESTETTTDEESFSDAPWVVRRDPPGLQRSIMATLNNSADNRSAAVSSAAVSSAAVSSAAVSSAAVSSAAVSSAAVGIDSASAEVIYGADETAAAANCDERTDVSITATGLASTDASNSEYCNGLEWNGFSGIALIQSLGEAEGTEHVVNGSSDFGNDILNGSSCYNTYITSGSQGAQLPYENSFNEKTGNDMTDAEKFVETNETRLVKVSNSHIIGDARVLNTDDDMLVPSNTEIASSVENECNGVPSGQSSTHKINSSSDNKELAHTVSEASSNIPAGHGILPTAEVDLEDHEAVERDVLYRASNGGNPSDLTSVLLYNNPCSSTLTSAEISKLPLVCDMDFLSQFHQSDLLIDDQSLTHPPLISPLPLALQHILALDLNIESITRYQAKPRSMYTFLCAQPFRRDEYSWHFRNVHTDIHSGLNGWLEARCPLAQYGCTYSVRRLTPHGGTLLFSSVLDSFGFRPISPSGTKKRVSCPKAARSEETCRKEEIKLVNPSRNLFDTKRSVVNSCIELTMNSNNSCKSTCNDEADTHSPAENLLLNKTTTLEPRALTQCENIIDCNGAGRDSEILSNGHDLNVDILDGSNMMSPEMRLSGSGKDMAQRAVNGHDSRSRSHKEMTPEIYTSNDYDSAIRVNSGARQLLCKPYHSYIVQHSPPREEDILSGLPFELLQEITRHLDPYSLCNLALTSYYMREVCRSVVEERGIVIQEWERFKKDGKYHWNITYQRWLFSTSFTPIDHWDLGDMSDMSEHLKVCPFLIRTEPSDLPVRLPAVSSNLSVKGAAVLQKIYEGFDPKADQEEPESVEEYECEDERGDGLFCSQFRGNKLGEYQSVLKNFAETISRKAAAVVGPADAAALALDDDDDDENYYSARSVCDDDGSEV